MWMRVWADDWTMHVDVFCCVVVVVVCVYVFVWCVVFSVLVCFHWLLCVWIVRSLFSDVHRAVIVQLCLCWSCVVVFGVLVLLLCVCGVCVCLVGAVAVGVVGVLVVSALVLLLFAKRWFKSVCYSSDVYVFAQFGVLVCSMHVLCVVVVSEL